MTSPALCLSVLTTKLNPPPPLATTPLSPLLYLSEMLPSRQNKKSKKKNSTHITFGDKFEQSGKFTTTTASGSGKAAKTVEDVDLGYNQPRKRPKLSQPTLESASDATMYPEAHNDHTSRSQACFSDLSEL